ETREAALDLSADRVPLKDLNRRPPRSLRLTGLGEDKRPLGKPLERLPDDLLGVPKPVLRGGVDPVDAALERQVDRPDRVRGLLVSPPPVPASAAYRPRSESDRRDVEPGVSQRDGHGAQSAPR